MCGRVSSQSRKSISLATLALLVLLASARTAHGQVVNGRVTGDAESEPVRGAVVALVDSSGTIVRSVLSNATGAFLISAPAPGIYRLRAEMIGRRSVESQPFELGAGGATRILALPSQPIRLDPVVVSVSSRCRSTGDATEATLRVWEEVQKALRAQSVTTEMGIYEFAIERTRRTLDAQSRRVLDETRSGGRSVAPTAFTSRPPSELAEEGYAFEEGTGTKLYGPSSEVLLSPEFEATHCFSLREGKNGRIGLVFKPVPERRVTDIEGVLWIDGQTAELQRLEFRFRRLPYGLVMGPYSGWIEFQRMEAGGWIIGSWELTTPVTQEGAEISGLEPVHTRAWAAESTREFEQWRCAQTTQNGAAAQNGASQGTEPVRCRTDVRRPPR